MQAALLLLCVITMWLVKVAWSPLRCPHVRASSVGDGASRRSGIRCVRAAHRAAPKVRVGHVQLSHPMHSNSASEGPAAVRFIGGAGSHSTKKRYVEPPPQNLEILFFFQVTTFFFRGDDPKKS